MPEQQPTVFLALVGENSATNRLYEELQRIIPQQTSQWTTEFLGDPIAAWDNVIIGPKEKKDYHPEARLLFRWGLFFEFNRTIVAPALARRPQLAIVRRYGFCVYEGAVKYAHSDLALALHHALLPHGVFHFGIPAPLYVFSEHLTGHMQMCQQKYFAEGSGQRYTTIDPTANMSVKVDGILGIIEQEMERRQAA